jgi:HSP20 family molecular chaperone IbpA
MWPDDIKRIFDMMDKMFDRDFTGGYMSSSGYKRDTEKDYSDGDMDMFTDDENVYITMDLNPLTEEEISVEVTRTHLRIGLLKEGNTYSKSFRFPVPVIPKSMKKTFVNSVLDITLSKAKVKIEE